MIEKLNAKRVSLSLAIVFGIISIVCAILIAVVPEGTLNLFGSIFHGIDITKIQTTMTFVGAILGTIVTILLALITGWLFAFIYNKLR